MSDPEKKEIVRLYKCLIETVTEVVLGFADDKLLLPKGWNFQKYLEDNTHFFYHQIVGNKTVPCCACPSVGCSLRRICSLDQYVFNTFYGDHGVEDKSHIMFSGGRVQQKCIHKFVARNIGLDDLDLSNVCVVLLTSGLLNSSERLNVEKIKEIRNYVSHISANCHPFNSLNSIWAELEVAVVNIAKPCLRKKVKKEIQAHKTHDLADEDTKELLSDMKKVFYMFIYII